MRKANGQLCALLLLLLACAAARRSASHAPAPAALTEQHPGNNTTKLELPGFPWWSSIVPVIGDPRIQQCWRSLLGTPSCVNSVFQSILVGRVVLSSECCGAIRGLGDSCVPRMFACLPLSNLIPGLLNGLCAAFGPAVPAHIPASPPPAGHQPTGKAF